VNRFVRGAIFIVFCIALVYFGGQEVFETPRARPPRSERVETRSDGTTALVSGKVVAISDGDTLQLRTDEQFTVRLEGIDAPERGQPFGNQARRHLSNLCYGKTATVAISGDDQFGRKLGTVTVGGEDINAAMVRDGYAWRYLHSDSKELARLESEARNESRGIWRDRDPTPPWIWRREHPNNDR
jgi:endonuclease YncB( thermonuclease family)